MLPSSSGARAEAPESILGTVRLVEVVLKPGSRACPPIATPAVGPGHCGVRSTPATPGLRSPGIDTNRWDAGDS